MRSSAFFLAVELCMSAALAVSQNPSTGTPATPQGSPIYITHVTVIDTATGKESRDRTVVLSGDRIAEEKPGNKAKPTTGAKVVDGKGKYLIPGLWDMHVHTWFEPSTYPLYIANGVTGVRDMAGPPAPFILGGKAPDADTFRSELAAKPVVAPHFHLASAVIDGYPMIWPGSIEVNTPGEARKVVDEQARAGADFLKVYSRLSREAYFAIIEESRRQNIPVEGHLPDLITAWEGSDARQKSFEHLIGIALACSSREEELRPKMAAATPKERVRLTREAWAGYSEAKCERLFRKFKENGTWQVPTLTVLRSMALLNDERFRRDDRLRFFGGHYRDLLGAKDDPRFKTFTAEDFAIQRELFAHNQKLVGAMFRAGVPMLAGTDAANPFCFPGFSLHDELALLVESGLTPLAALQAATLNAAVFMEATDRYGSVAPGKVADLVLLDADPLKDIHNTARISEVFFSGKEFDRAALDQILKDAESAAAGAPSGSNK